MLQFWHADLPLLRSRGLAPHISQGALRQAFATYELLDALHGKEEQRNAQGAAPHEHEPRRWDPAPHRVHPT